MTEDDRQIKAAIRANLAGKLNVARQRLNDVMTLSMNATSLINEVMHAIEYDIAWMREVEFAKDLERVAASRTKERKPKRRRRAAKQ